LLTASFRSRLATGTLAVRLALPLAGCALDSNQLVSAPCRAHPTKAAAGRHFYGKSNKDSGIRRKTLRSMSRLYPRCGYGVDMVRIRCDSLGRPDSTRLVLWLSERAMFHEEQRGGLVFPERDCRNASCGSWRGRAGAKRSGSCRRGLWMCWARFGAWRHYGAWLGLPAL